MAAPTRTPRRTWIDAGLRALGDGGAEAIRIEPLARSLGVTRGGFYWHFHDRPALLSEILDAWEQVGVHEVIDRIEGGGGDARTRLRRLFGEALLGDELLRIDLAVREWARRDPEVAERLRRVDNERMAYMRGLFAELCAGDDEVEARCLAAASLWIGSHFLAADHDGRTRAEVVEQAFERLLA